MNVEKSVLPAELEAKLGALRDILTGMKRVLVAFSGGVDSSFLLKAASDVLGGEVLAVVAASETYPAREVESALKLASELGIRCRLIHTHEMDDPCFTSNPPQRCYYCKTELFSSLRKIADEEKIEFLLDGQNFDDLRDYRPGSRAAAELGVRSPLREARLTKDDIRVLSREAALPTWDKPAMACLASRFPYHTAIDGPSLTKVAQAEDYLRGLGLRQVRLRHHGQMARIEIDPEDIGRLLGPDLRRGIVAKLKELGYLYVTLDLEGYRTGSMNEALDPAAKGGG